MQWCLLDSNVRNLYFKEPDFTSFIKEELFKKNQSGRIDQTMYLAPPFMVFEMLSYGKYKVPYFDNPKLLEKLEGTEHGSTEEAKAANEYFLYFFSKYQQIVESDKRFSINSLRKRFDIQKSYVHPMNRKDFDSVFARRIGSSFRRQYIKDFLAFELFVSHDFKGIDPDRMARFFLVTASRFFKDRRENSFYRAMVRIWKDSYKGNLINQRNAHGTFKNFTDEAISRFEKSIKLGKGEDFLDSEGIQFLLMGFQDKETTEEVIMITGDPEETFLQRVGFFKSLYQLTDILFEDHGTNLPPLKEGLIGFINTERESIKWVETASIPPFLHFLEHGTYDEYLGLLKDVSP